MNRKKIIIFLLLIILSTSSLYANFIDWLSGNGKEKREQTANELLSTLLADGTLNSGEEVSVFSQIIGSTADLVLCGIYNALTPSLKNILNVNVSLRESKSAMPRAGSFLGALITILIVFECIILGIENMLSFSEGGIIKAAAHIISIIFVIIFIAFLPVISSAILNIFANLGTILAEGTVSTVLSDEHPFAFMPSDILESLNFCRSILDIEKIRIGGYGITTLVPHLVIIIGEFVVTIPFLYLMMLIVFWYSEMFLILLAAYLYLPLTIFSKTDITNVKNILKAFILQGMKICLGIFLSGLISNVIISSVQNIDGFFSSTMHAVLFCVFITVTLLYILKKRPDIIMSAVLGQNTQSSASSLLSGIVGGSVAASAGAIRSMLPQRKNTSSSSHNVEDEPKNETLSTASNEANSNQSKTNPHESGHSEGESEPEKEIESPADETETKSKEQNYYPTLNDYGEVTARATKQRIEAARLEYQREGIMNPSDEQLVDKAKNDAIIQKLLKMEKKGFILQDGTYNAPAARQLERLRKAKNE